MLPQSRFGEACRPVTGGAPRNGLPARQQQRLLPQWREVEGLAAADGYSIALASTAFQLGMASMLVREMYAWRGYRSDGRSPSADDPNRLTLAAWHAERIVATLTLGRDSAAGLLADALYAEELARLRRPGRIVCELSRLAVDPRFSSRELLHRLVGAAHRIVRTNFSASDVVIEVNPRHVRYYQRSFGFRQLGSVRRCPRVDAPAVLLHRTLEDFVMASRRRCQ